VKPWGDPQKAEILVIGHDPRLRNSDTEAEYAFFFNFLQSNEPKTTKDKSKYNLAKGLTDYVQYLTGGRYGVHNKEYLYITNLCNRFLERPEEGGTVLIPPEEAKRGISEINKILSEGSFKLIIPMSLQVFYLFVKNDFISNNNNELNLFIEKAKPAERYEKKKAYVASENKAFNDVFGKKYFHNGIPTIPVPHVKQWLAWKKWEFYFHYPNNATESINSILTR
jgi:hypothetical protein